MLVWVFSWDLLMYHSKRLTLSTGNILDSRPPVEDHGAVVVNVKESHLTALLSQDEEELLIKRTRGDSFTFNPVFLHWYWMLLQIFTYCVTELYDLGEEEPPADSGHLEEGNNGERYAWYSSLCICTVNLLIFQSLSCLVLSWSGPDRYEIFGADTSSGEKENADILYRPI